jgi:hypothetical protein
MNQKFNLSMHLWFLERSGKWTDRVKAPKKYLTTDTAVRGLWNADVDGMYDPRQHLSSHNDKLNWSITDGDYQFVAIFHGSRLRLVRTC